MLGLLVAYFSWWAPARSGTQTLRTESNSSGHLSRAPRLLAVPFQSKPHTTRGRREYARKLSAAMQHPALLRPLVRQPLVSVSPLAAQRQSLGFRRSVRVGCAPGSGAGGGGDGDGAAAWLSSAVGEKVDELLQREENRSLLEGVEAAERRVERARAALADIQRQEAAARLAREEVRRLEKRRDEVCNRSSPRHVLDVGLQPVR